MYGKEGIEELALDFKSWGLRAVRRIEKLTKKYGVICSDWEWSNKKKG